MSRNVAIITARGGSKRIPRKNIKDFLGKPIIAYSIDSAQHSGCFDEVMVSTDDHEIAEVALRYGAQVPFLRSVDTSSDFATTAEVLIEVLNSYLQQDRMFDYACCLYPTAPFVTADNLRSAFNLLLQTGAETVLPVVCFGYPIQRALKIEDNRVRMIWPENMNIRSQDLLPAYHDSGQFYFFQTELFLATQQLFGGHTVPLVVPESEVQDIDTEEDWRIAEMKYQLLQQPGARHGSV